MKAKKRAVLYISEFCRIVYVVKEYNFWILINVIIEKFIIVFEICLKLF
jgi:hypothetical protein